MSNNRHNYNSDQSRYIEVLYNPQYSSQGEQTSPARKERNDHKYRRNYNVADLDSPFVEEFRRPERRNLNDHIVMKPIQEHALDYDSNRTPSPQAWNSKISREDSSIYLNPSSNPPPEKKRWKCVKYFCCCIPRKRSNQIICGIVTILVLVGLALCGYFFFPRFPYIKVLELNLEEGGMKFSIANNTNNLNQLRIQLDMEMLVSTYNPNEYGLDVDSIDLSAQLMVNKSWVYSRKKTQTLLSFDEFVRAVGPAPTGRDKFPNYHPSNRSVIGTSHADRIFFPAKENITYKMVFRIDYTPDSVVGLLEDPTILELANGCGITGSSRPMKIHYKAVSKIGWLNAIGYAPVVENDVFIGCPIDIDKMSQLAAIMKENDLSALDALRTVLGA